jgi:anti-sigma B factor antagonist
MSASMSYHQDLDLPLSLEIVEDGPVTVVVVVGELDMDTTPDLVATVWRLAAKQPSRLVLDCARVTFFGAAGVTALRQAQAALAAVSGHLLLRDPSPIMHRVLHAVDCWDTFTMDHGHRSDPADLDIRTEEPGNRSS